MRGSTVSLAESRPGELPEPPYSGDVRATGWRPDLDINRVMKSETWGMASDEERPWLLRIWIEPWQSIPVGSMPRDLDVFAHRIGCSRAYLDAHHDVLFRGWSLHSDGRLYHRTISEKILGLLAKRRAASARKAAYRLSRGTSANPTEVSQNSGTPTNDVSRGTSPVGHLSRGTSLIHPEVSASSGILSHGTPPCPMGHPVLSHGTSQSPPMLVVAHAPGACSPRAREDILSISPNQVTQETLVALSSKCEESSAPLVPTQSVEKTPYVEFEPQPVDNSVDNLPDDFFPDAPILEAAPAPAALLLDQMVAEVFNFWRETMGHGHSRLSTKRDRAIRGRLVKDGFGVGDLKTAILGCKVSPYHQGRNEHGTVYDDIELICRDAGKVEAFIMRHRRHSGHDDELALWLAGHSDSGLIIEGEVDHG